MGGVLFWTKIGWEGLGGLVNIKVFPPRTLTQRHLGRREYLSPYNLPGDSSSLAQILIALEILSRKSLHPLPP